MKKLYSRNVLIQEELVEALITLDNGIISNVISNPTDYDKNGAIDHGDNVIMPGLIDSHVHINEPGRTDWEGFDTATRAAAAGGITTLVDMPLNSLPVTTTKSAFEAKLESTKGNLHVNCGFWGGVIPQNSDSIREILDCGVLGIKAFLTHSGIDEFPNVTARDLRKAMPIIGEVGVKLLVHCELDQDHTGIQYLQDNPKSYDAFLNSRPRSWENDAIELMIELAKDTHCDVHIVHLSSSDPILLLKTMRESGMPLTVETCPHYLHFDAESIPDGRPIFKCAPPIREKENNDQLWRALESGIIDFIVTDHSPAPPEMKQLKTGNLNKAWGGISGLQHALPITWTDAVQRGFDIPQLAKWMSGNVAEFLNLQNRKGKITTGFDADITVWNPDHKYKIEPDSLHYKHKVSPYIYEQVQGMVVQTYVGGNLVYDNGKFTALNQGQLILRES